MPTDARVQTFTTLTDLTTDDSLVAVRRTTNEGEIIDYNLLADKILEKLTSKTFSGLETSAKAVIGAINELDADVASLNSDLGKVSFPKSGETIDITFAAIGTAVSTSRLYATLYLPFRIVGSYSTTITAVGSIVNVGTPNPTVSNRGASTIYFYVDAPTGKTFTMGNSYYWNGVTIRLSIP